MSAQYDSIAAGYQQTKQSPLREYVEVHSFMRMLGDVRGLRVLDLACGEGFYSRRIRMAGAASVTGVDISAAMIELAEAAEAREPLGINYCCADVAGLRLPERFDRVAAAYLLHYAKDVAELEAMCSSIAGCLEPGGRLVAINENPRQPATNYRGYTQYGFNKQFAQPRSDGSVIEYSMLAGREMIRFNARYFSAETYTSALHKAGFSNVNWLPLELDPAGIDALGEDYWRAYLDNPPVIGLEALR